MSFRLADLKKSVRKGREGYQVTPTRLEGRPAAFRIEFLLQQFEGHLGCPRRMLDPDSLLDFMGDARLGRGLLATLSQWYRVRPRTFAEVLPEGGARLLERSIAGPIDLRAWLYDAVNRGGPGYLDPEGEALFWQRQVRALGFRAEELRKLMLLDRPEEAVLVRTGPPPAAVDVMAAYNARAQTTLLRSASQVALACAAPGPFLERAARAWAVPLEVEWQAEGDTLKLFGRADALGCWTRHGRRVERAALELLALPELAVRELRGQVAIAGRECRFCWKADTLELLGAGCGSPLWDALPGQVIALAAALRRERERNEASSWSIRQATHLLGVEGGVSLPHLALRYGDLAIPLRLLGPELAGTAVGAIAPFRGKTPIALLVRTGEPEDSITLQWPGEAPQECAADRLLAMLADRLDSQHTATASGTARAPQRPVREAA